MKSLWTAILILSTLPATAAAGLDCSMPRATLAWLQFIRAGNSDEAVRARFMETVAPTQGCRVIIRHWARFRKDWNNDTFLDFILQALGRRPAPGAEHEADGSLTAFGRRRNLWTRALRHPEEWQRRLDELAGLDLMTDARRRAGAVLPPGTPLDNRFSLVMFGASTAFSVGDENGIDLLQLPERSDGRLDLDEIRDILAHELHHTGFAYWLDRNFPKMSYGPVTLPLILATEGSATHFIDRIPQHLKTFSARKGTVYTRVAQDWRRYSAALPDLFRRAARDMQELLAGRLKPADIMNWWMRGAKGPAYILGGRMIAVIEAELGREAVFQMIRNFRTLLTTYNRAARRAELRGEHPYRFPPDLARRLENYPADPS